MKFLTLFAAFAFAVTLCRGASEPGIELVEWTSLLRLTKGKLVEARFVSAKGSTRGALVYYEYVEDGRTRFIHTVGSLSGLSLLLARELPSQPDALALQSRVPEVMRVAYFNGRLQVQILDSEYARSYSASESYTAAYLKQESLDPKAVIEGSHWKLKFRMIDEVQNARIEEWELKGALSPFSISEAQVRLLPVDGRLDVEPHL